MDLWLFVQSNSEVTFYEVECLSLINVYLQGQSRRVQVKVRSVPDSGTMPLIAASILSVSIGDVKVRQTRLSKSGQWVRRIEVLLVLVCQIRSLTKLPTSLPTVFFFDRS